MSLATSSDELFSKIILVSSIASLYACTFIASFFRGNGWSDFHSTTTRRESLTAGETAKKKPTRQTWA
nr:MAG TPA: hypothetical protein [Caudoviricetes sp.]